MLDLTEVKKEIDQEFNELRIKRRNILSAFRKKLEEKEIEKIKSLIKDK